MQTNADPLLTSWHRRTKNGSHVKPLSLSFLSEPLNRNRIWHYQRLDGALAFQNRQMMGCCQGPEKPYSSIEQLSGWIQFRQQLVSGFNGGQAVRWESGAIDQWL